MRGKRASTTGRVAACCALAATMALAAAPAWAADNTTVKVTTTIDNISAVVPLELPVTVPAAGGAATSVPSNYAIENTSAFPIKVTQLVATAKDGWGVASTTQSSDSVSTNTVGDIYLKLTPTGKTGAVLNTVAVPLTGWSMAGKADAANAKLSMAVECSVSQLKKTFETATDTLTIAYTVTADPAYTPPAPPAS